MSNDSPQNFGSDESKAVPKLVLRNPDPPEPETSYQDRATTQKDDLPDPTGYRLLLVPYSMPRFSKGGIRYADRTIQTEELATTVGFVVKTGPDAYADPLKFPKGPWCEEGDYVLFGRYAGARIFMHCEDDDPLPLRLLNDDEILAKLSNPEDYVGVQ